MVYCCPHIQCGFNPAMKIVFDCSLIFPGHFQNVWKGYQRCVSTSRAVVGIKGKEYIFFQICFTVLLYKLLFLVLTDDPRTSIQKWGTNQSSTSAGLHRECRESTQGFTQLPIPTNPNSRVWHKESQGFT